MKSDVWYVDSGASSHMTGNKELLSDLSNAHLGQEIVVANNSKLCVCGTGNARVTLKLSGAEKTISEVKYVPNLTANLLSVNSLVSKGYCVHFDPHGCKILDQEECYIKGEPIATATNIDGLFKLDTLVEQVNVAQGINSQMLWHQRLGHLNHYSMSLLKNGLATGMTYEDPETPVQCESCIKGKHARKPFPCNKTKSVAKNKLDLIHSDLVGPMEVESWSGARFMFTLIDDHSRKVFCYLPRSKDEVPDIPFKNFVLL